MESLSDPKQYTKLCVHTCVECVNIYVAKNGRVRMPELKSVSSIMTLWPTDSLSLSFLI